MIVAPSSEQQLPTIVTWRRRADGVITQVSWLLPLLLVFATEYKFRRRTNEDALTGQVDPWILLELGIYALVGLYLLVRLRPRLRPHPILVWTAGYCLSCAVAAIYSPFLTMAMVRGMQMVIVLLTVLRFVDDGDLSSMRRFLHGYLVLVTVSVLVGMAFVMPTTRAQAGRFTWLSVHSVVAGAMLGMSVVILFGMWITHRAARLPWARWVYGALLVFHLVALLRTQTRGSIGAALMAVVIMALLWLRSEGKRDLLIGSVVSVLAVALAFGPTIVAYVLRDNDVAELATFNRRTEIWTLAWESFLRHPLQGRGFNQAGIGGLFFEKGKGGVLPPFPPLQSLCRGSVDELASTKLGAARHFGAKAVGEGGRRGDTVLADVDVAHLDQPGELRPGQPAHERATVAADRQWIVDREVRGFDDALLAQEHGQRHPADVTDPDCAIQPLSLIHI